ncbi:InlB B-repeat-containing protein [Holdemanella biformis]|uniref:InlB B-repeat-containing protein n=2 Tax=Holdemanella biformis TaxID=1735 RepID=UPI0022E96CE1|nr:InlB B-repeat-containing protein [Holdemanella biformis]
MLKNLKRAAAIVLSFAMAIQFGLANSYYVNAEEEPVEPQQEQTTTVENNSEVQEEDANEVAVPETKSVELSYVAEDGTILQAATYRDFDLNYGLNTDSSVMLNFDGYTLKDVIVNNSQTVSADQASLSVTSDLVSVKFVYVSVNTKEDKQTSENNEQTKTEEANEDDAEADPEVKEELVEYPAFDQSEMAGDVVVHATAAEGVLPRDSKLVVKRITRKAILNAVEDAVSEKNKEMDSAVALDITIQNKDGVEIQPNGSVNISFENVSVSGGEINVYHVSDDASAVTEVATNTQSFDADHFSIYVITNENQVPLTTFEFVANGTTVSTQIVKSGDTLIAPTAPDAIGQAFVGWVDEAGNPFTGFGKQAEITETTKRTITARYEAALYVYFLNPDGTQIMRTEKVGDYEAHDFTAISYDVDSTHKLVGWAAEKNGTTNIADKITVPKGSTSVNVYAIIKEGYWISFDSDGGSIVDSQFVLNGGQLDLNENTNPTKPGYTFDGWYNGPTKVEKGTTVTSPMTLKAHWSATQVSYTVIHWWENADDNEYSFHESETKTGLTGSEVNAKAKSYEGFTAQPVTKKTIKGDGSTIVSVYYKRNVYEVTFYSFSEGFGLWYKPSKEYTDLKITAKYGQDISKQWPTMNGSSTWRTKDGSGAYQVNIGTMPLGGTKFYGPKTGKKYETASYYVEVLPGETSDVTVGGIQYKLDHKDTSPGTGYFVTKEDQYPLKGFTFNEKSSTKIEEDYNNAKFYYTRNSYKIKFINNGKEDKSVEKKYEQSISNENYTPDKPNSLATYYEFDGWYDNELCEGEKYVFDGKTMPAQNVTLYAKWTAKKISLTYNLNNPKGTVDKDTKKVAAGTIASTVLPSASSIEGYSFAGWYVADENGHMTTVAFNANDAITKDTSVIGKWLYNGKLTVKYVADGVEAPKDNNVYAGGAKATVASGVTKEGKKFLGWQLDKLDRNVYQPGQSFEVNKDLADDKNVITLKAVFGDSETSAILTYHRGNGNGEDHSDAILNNVEVTLKNTSDPSLSYTAPGEDYYFAGWATSVEDAQKGNAAYAAGERVRVNADSSNDLYATWVKKTVIEVTANSNTLPYNGEERKVEGFSVTSGYEVTGLTAVAKGINCGTYETKITGTAIVTKDGVDVTDKVIVNKKNGTLTITPKSVTVTGNNGNKVYGEADPELTATVAGTLGKDKVKYTVARESGEDVGHYSVIPTGEEIQGNYKVTYKNGDFEITKAEKMTLTPELTGKDAEKVYDGQPLSGGATASVKEGTTITYSTDDGKTWSETLPSITNVGTLNVKAKAENKNYKDVTVDYTLTVKHRNVTVTGNNGNKVYGEADPELTATVAGTLGKDKVKYTVARESGEDVGHYSVIPTGEEIQGNYKVTYVAGTLTITAQSIDPGTDPDKPNPDYTGAKVNNPSDEVYDGKEHKWIPTVTDKADKKLKVGTDYTVEYSTKNFKDVGTIDVTITGIKNYTGKATRTYSITPKTYTVTTESASKVYDRTALTAGGKVSGIIKGETVDFTMTGSQTNVGASDNTYELNWTGSAKESNYKHGKDSIGTLTVTAKSIIPDGPDTPEEEKTGITVSDPSDSKYDGKEHREVLTVKDTKTNEELVAEKDYSVTYSDDLVNAGTVTITIEGIGNYTGSFTKTYEITKRSVTLTSATASKTYDGQALTSTSITVSGDGFVKGEGATYNVTGTQTEVGNSANSFEYKLNENTLASNYDITKVVGTLTVTRDTTPVTPAPTPTTPSVPPVVQRVVPTPTPVPEEKVEEEQTPKAEPKEEEKVEEDYTPKATQEYYWALINLICAIVTVLFGLLLLISKRHKDEDDEEEDDETKQQATTNEDEEQEQEKKRGLFTRVLAVLIAIVSVVFFLVTEDMSLAWTWTDQWTIWMVVIGLVQIVVFFVGRKWKNVDNDDDDEEAQQA